MGSLQNLDLFSVGMAIAGIGVLGFVVYLNNKKSVTNRALAFFALVAIFWNIFNYLIFQLLDPATALWILRFHVFFAVWYCFFLFHFFYVFPKEDMEFSKYYDYLLIPIVIITSILNLTPLVFQSVASVSANGQIEKVVNGPAIFLFGILVVSLIIGGVSILLRKILRATGSEKLQLKFILIGTIITFTLHVVFNLIFPAFFDNPRFIPLGAMFTFPFVAFSAYAILKHHFLGIKVIATEILMFVLSIAVLYEVIFAESLTVRILRSGVFLLVLGLGILLIKSVRKEVEQREKLQILSQQKSEFLSFASHQVKSPMSGVKGFAQLIADGTYGTVTPEAKEKAQRIKEIADRTIAMVNNFLDFNKIEEGKTMDLKLGDVDMVSFVAGMVEEYRVVAKDQNKDIKIQFEHSMPSLIAKIDQEKMRQVIQNVIDNAVKYTEHGYVKVTVSEEKLDMDDKGTVRHSDILQNVGMSYGALITVEDSGKGMSKELQAKLFGRYVRDEKTKNEVQGTGLGLYIAKSIVEAHHGKIWVESEGENKGSKFFIQLAENVS